MNTISGIVQASEQSGELALLHIDSCGSLLYVLLIEQDSEQAYMQQGSLVSILFKETDGELLPLTPTNTLIHNQLSCKILAIEYGQILCQISLQCHEQQFNLLQLNHDMALHSYTIGQQVVLSLRSHELMIRH